MLHDAIVIGFDEDAISAAITAANTGLDVLLVDVLEADGSPRQMPGPLLLGLLHETILEIHAAHRVLEREKTPSELRALFGRVLARKRDEGVRFNLAFQRERLGQARVRVASGLPRFLSATSVEIAPGDVRHSAIIVVAVGSRARRPPRFPFDQRVVFDTDSALLDDSIPRSLLVIGADIVGCEFACTFAALGCPVTLVDRRRRLLRFVDPDLREILHSWLQRTGVSVVLDEEVLDVRRAGSGSDEHAVVVLGSGRTEVSERVLIAAGGSPNTGDLRLESAGIATNERGFVVVDDRWRTSRLGIWATGGAVDPLVGVATLGNQGRSAMLDALGAGSDTTVEAPLVVHTVPELAAVGLSEEACEHLGLGSFSVSVPLGRVLRARIRGEEEGILKLVADRDTQRLLGVHVIGRGAHEIVNLGSALMQKGATLEDVASTVFIPGSLSVAYRSAALEGLRQRAGRRCGRGPRRAPGTGGEPPSRRAS